MSKKFSFIFSLLVFAILFSFIGCTDLLAPKAQTDINLKIDLSKIIKSSRNEGGSQGASSLGDNPTIKVAIYDAKDYDKATNSTENLTLITQAQASVGRDGIARVKLSDIPVGIDAIVFAELSFTDENSTQVVYAGNSGVFKVKASDNKVSLVLMKVGNDSEPPIDDTGSGETYVVEDFILYTKDNGDETEVDSNEYATLTNETEYTEVTVKNPGNSDSVWTYFVKPNNNTRFTESGNYKVSVELKTKSDATTVVGIAAARADYFFTVNDTWTPCEFNTGYLIGNENHQFTIGLGLSSEIQIKNLKIEKLKTTDTTEPSLVFDISRHAIETYIGKDDKATKIIDVSKNSTERSYNITINAPLSHSATVQDVKLHLRSYATENTGANRVSFKITNNGSNDFETSVMADTAIDKSISWNNNASPIFANDFQTFSVDFPNYVENDELIVDLITSSTSTSQDNSTSFTLSNFKVEKAGDSPFSDKIFAIKTGATWTQGKSVEVTIPVNGNKEFDVGMFNSWDYSKNMPSSFDDVTRFFYTGSKQISEKLAYSYNDNPNDPIFTITNESVEDKIVKISLNENYEVVIEDVSSIVTTWADLKYRIDNTSISEIEITKDLVPTIEIRIGRAIKISAQNNKTISRDQNYTGTFFIVPTASLELSNITLDGGNKNYINATGPLIWAESGSTSLTLTNCILQNNTIVNPENNPTYEQGGAVKTEQPFTMKGGSIIDCHGSNGGAVYTFHNGSFTMNGGSIKNCTATENGNAVYIGSGNLTLSGDAEITSDVYLASGTTVTVSGELNPPDDANGIVATITPSEYTVGKQILSADGVDLAQQVDKFTLSNEEYCIGSDGKIASAINYAQGLTYDSTSNTLYISNEEGLITFRDIVNETLAAPVTIEDTSSSNTDITFDYTYPTGYDNSARTLNAKLTNDITLSGDWTPIGHSSIYSYAGTFDGDGHTISNLNINETTSSDSTGFIGYSGYNSTGGIIQNLVISGTMNVNSAAAGGFVGTSACGCRITNCVNQINITNTSEADYTGTAGFVGLLEKNYEVNISNSINLGNITGTNNVAGFVGSYANSSYTQSVYTIDKSINIGKIIASKAAKTAAGFSAISASSSKSLTNLINMGTLGNYDVAGICYFFTGSTMTISNCINTGKSDITSGTYNAIIPLDNKPTSNCYFDNSINPDYPYGGTGKTTAELCDLSQNDLSNDWKFADGRYPLPDIVSSIPGGEEGEIWQGVITAATPTDIGGGTPNYTVYTDYATLKNAVVAISSGDSGVFYVQGDIESTSTTITVKGDVTIIATSEGATISRKSTFTGGAIFAVNNGASLKLGGDTSGFLIIDGGSENGVAATSPLIDSSGSLEIAKNCTLQNNNNTGTSKKGGAIYESCTSGTSPILKISDGTIRNCQSSKGGGAIYVSGNSSCQINVEFNGGEICDNYASSNGGGLYLKYTTGAISGTKIYNNYANVSSGSTSGGGGIYSSNSTITINGGEIKNNTTKAYGGGIYVGANTTVTILGGDIKDNTTPSTTDSLNIYNFTGTVKAKEDESSTEATEEITGASNYNIINGVLTTEVSNFEYEDK